ncbi:MAG TPA: nuclear transport factor 2 family protein [Microlunatus sp.]
MTLSTEDRLQIEQLLNLHGHLCDAGAFDRFTEIFTDDVRYDTTAVGGEVLIGPGGGRDAALALGDKNPVAHLISNIVIGNESDDGVEVVSKGLGLRTSGELGCVVYQDRLVRTADGWRIASRVITPRSAPLQPYPLPAF